MSFFKYYQNRQQQYIMYIKYKLFVTIAYQAVQSKLIDFFSFISQYINFEIKNLSKASKNYPSKFMEDQ